MTIKRKVRIKLTPLERKIADDGTIVWWGRKNKGKPIGVKEMLRRKTFLMKANTMNHAQIDEIVALMPYTRIARLRDEQDVLDLAALLATAFGVGALQMQIAEALSRRCLHTWGSLT